jgi:hypothetical protein
MLAMRHKLTVCSMFLLFACAYATLDRIPRGAAQVLRGSVEYVQRSYNPAIANDPED